MIINALYQVEFDLMALDYLNRLDKKLSSENLKRVREEFQNDKELLIYKIICVDEARKVQDKDSFIMVNKVKRKRKKVEK